MPTRISKGSARSVSELRSESPCPPGGRRGAIPHPGPSIHSMAGTPIGRGATASGTGSSRKPKRRTPSRARTIGRPWTSAAPGHASSGRCTRSIPSCVRAANQNAHAFRDRPAEICITHPPHPLFGQRLAVVHPRHERDATHWVLRLQDGSRIQIPSSWTDHPVGQVPIQRIRPGGRATPDALRDLLALLRALVGPARIPDACSRVPAKEAQMSKQLLLFDPQRHAWIQRIWLRIDPHGQLIYTNRES